MAQYIQQSVSYTEYLQIISNYTLAQLFVICLVFMMINNHAGSRMHVCSHFPILNSIFNV
jgi:hypothetical protein